MKKVFISYVRSNSDMVNRICEELKANNIEYWLDREQIKPGTLWKTAIKDAINDGAYFLACFSREYEEKAETHMNEELLLAVKILRKKHFNSGWFIPIKLSPCNIPPYDIGASCTLQDIQYLELHLDWDIGIKRLIDIIKREEESKSDEYYEKLHEKQYIYQGLKSLIESGNGVGFHNADQGHPVYLSGASGRLDKSWEYADSPEKNLLFQTLSKLTKELKEAGIEEFRFIWWYDFSEWKDFCKFAVDAYNKKHGYT
jgi:hypothetical protein